MKKPRGNKTLLIAGIVWLLFAIGLATVLTTPKMTVLVPKEDLPPVKKLGPQHFEEVQVERNDSALGKRYLTPEWLKKNVGKGDPFLSMDQLGKGFPVDVKDLITDTSGSIASMKDDETQVSVRTTLAGAVGGTLRPGDVVNVYTSDGGEINFAKVVGYGLGAAAGENVTGGDTSEKGSGGKVGSGNESDLLAILIIKREDAVTLFGSGSTEVSLALTNCRVDANGFFEPIEGASAATCEAPGRIASRSGGGSGTSADKTKTGDTLSGTSSGTSSGAAGDTSNNALEVQDGAKAPSVPNDSNVPN